MGRWSRRLAPLFVTFAGVTEGDRVLDVGSGTGALSAAAAAIESVQVTGIEPVGSLRALRAGARERPLRSRRRDGAAVRRRRLQSDTGDARAQLRPDPAAALQQMIRVTRPGGVVAAAVWDYGDGMQMLRTFWDAAVALDPAAAPRDERHMPLCYARGAHRSVADARTAGCRRATADDRDAVRSFDDYWQPFLGGQGPAGVYVASIGRISSARIGIQAARALGSIRI